MSLLDEQQQRLFASLEALRFGGEGTAPWRTLLAWILIRSPRDAGSCGRTMSWSIAAGARAAGARYWVVERRRVPERSQIQRDEVIRLTWAEAETKCPRRNLRCVEVYDPDKAETLIFVTNHLRKLGPGSVGDSSEYNEEEALQARYRALRVRNYSRFLSRSGTERRLPMRWLLACCLVLSSVAAASAQKDVLGQWDAPHDWGFRVVHAGLIPTKDRVIVWGYSLNHSTVMHEVNPFTFETEEGTGLTSSFCAGNEQLADGSLFVVGGVGENNESGIYDLPNDDVAEARLHELASVLPVRNHFGRRESTRDGGQWR